MIHAAAVIVSRQRAARSLARYQSINQSSKQASNAACHAKPMQSLFDRSFVRSFVRTTTPNQTAHRRNRSSRQQSHARKETYTLKEHHGNDDRGFVVGCVFQQSKR